MGLNDGNGVPKIMVFRPTLEEMKDFSKYVEKMEAQGANKAGLAKIIPPPEWCPRKGGYDDDYVNDMVIKAPIMQVVNGRQGLYQQYNIQKKALTVREFKKAAESSRYRTPDYFDYEDLERKYWKNVTYNPAIYGADVPGTLYDPDVKEFNINHLNTILDLVNDSYGIKIMGVNTAYLYFGMWKTTFAWHTEDMDLYSINYLHFGAPKSWYAIPPEHGRRLERLAAGFFPCSNKNCSSFLRHKMTLISPQVLKQYSIPFNKITQEPGEFMITFPYAYHAGYNHGYNCAESTNFALPRWVEYGKRATKCLCRSDSVKISMETFVKKFQPDRYELWLQGKDIGPHPEDPSHICAAPRPTDYELEVMSKVKTSKSKRHPPYKMDSYEDSDTEEYSDSDCDDSNKVTSVVTKAAKKSFESSNSSVNDEVKSYLKITPPDLMEPVKNLKSRGVPKKKKKTSSSIIPPHLMTHSYAKPACTNPPTLLNSLSWPTVTMPSVPNDVSQMLNKLFTPPSSSQTPDVSKASSNAESQSSFSESQGVQTSYSSVPPPPPPLQIKQNKTQHLESVDNGSHRWIPPPPPLKQLHTPTLAEFNSFNFSMDYNYASSPDLKHFTDNTNSLQLQPLLPESKNYSENSCIEEKKILEEPIVLDDYTIQHSVVIPSGKAEAWTSTDDLLVNDIIVRTRSVQASELLKLVCSGTPNSDLNQLLKCVPIPIHLYQHLPYNYFGEQLFNASISTIYPHCAVCILLRKFEISNDWLEAQKTIPKSSPVLIPNAAFAFKVIDQNTTLDEIGSSPLMVCSDCKVCVHEVCYGVVNNRNDGYEGNWKCDRCRLKRHGIHCSLCPFRGGALKQAEDANVWVHITCALMQPDAKFKNGITKSPIEINGVKKTKGINNLRCFYCQKANNRLADYIMGYCIQCYKAPKCIISFHVTCAHIAGIVFEASDWPDPIRAYCQKCTSHTLKRIAAENEGDDIEINTKVIARHRNRRYYEATVIGKSTEIRHHVHFVDNSFTENVRTSDIISHEWSESNPIEIGDQVQVNWNKDRLTGKYSGNHSIYVYTLLFEDNSRCKARRKDFYLHTEKLPKRVEQKLSQATDQKHNALFQKSEKTAKLLKD
ncbi:lysine-specific demethylase 4C-like protein [Dinothrombium tinctorium]|uniref:[histone H3]-trimethyl-L-lysine(9) demethylase n=1 Tax=Dinothrombium tinctorium TaxID=1965070 RepID=A0A3S3PKI6_9ACAR|nr:lysine-specific demethylase 4C-like protein [Dinothrombium tinctorium]